MEHREAARRIGVNRRMAFKAHFLNQGRVDSILLEYECDESMKEFFGLDVECDQSKKKLFGFVDGGYRGNGIKVVNGYLKELGVKKLEFYIASHGHKNHIGAAAPIIAAYRPETIICGRKEVYNAIKRFAKTLDEEWIIETTPLRILHVGHIFHLGGATITCIGPERQKSISTGAYAENYNSLILRVDYEGKSALLLTGDSTAAIIAKCKTEAQAEILKSPHHAGSQPASLLKQVKPGAVIVCSNIRAGAAYRKRIKAAGAALWNTCDGRVVL